MMLEVLIKKSDLSLIKTLRESRIFGTTTFMIMSGIILNVLQKGNLNEFWLISPVKVKNEDLGTSVEQPHKLCSHEEASCINYLKAVKITIFFFEI